MIVIDASVWVSRFIPQDINHNASRNLIENYIANDEQLAAPVILLAEIAGAISRRNGQAELAQRIVDQVRLLPTLRLIEITRPSGRIAAQLAADLQLRGADALYVAVAQRLRMPLVTWDQEQLNRGRRLIQVFSPNELIP
jgi:predicted nucleic acid-binding protein